MQTNVDLQNSQNKVGQSDLTQTNNQTKNDGQNLNSGEEKDKIFKGSDGNQIENFNHSEDREVHIFFVDAQRTHKTPGRKDLFKSIRNNEAKRQGRHD